MNDFMIGNIRSVLLYLGKNICLRRSNPAIFFICCFTLALVSGKSFAEDASTRTIYIKDEDTQLAKRFAVRESVEPPFEYYLGVGYRKDYLKWSIADSTVNVASEVTWKNTVIAQLRAGAKIKLWGDWLLRGIYTTGAVKSGTNRDSDYAGINRTQEYSRSDNKTGGAVEDLSIGLGRKIRLFDKPVASLSVVPLAGISAHQQSLTMYDGYQSIPVNFGAFPGLDNSYDTQWKGSWLGMDALLGLGERFSLNATFEYHWVDYKADANWNLRGDLAHPVSFSHYAYGHGKLGSVGGSYRLSRNFLLNVSAERQVWSTYKGYDQTNFSYGGTSYFTLHSIRWTSTSYTLGAVYQF